jgi:undecaprenyl-diphosphatase
VRVSDIIDAIVLGIVQGLTEFLPVSSTGHLILTGEVLGIDDETFGLQFDAAIHLGTLAAVLLYFRTTWISLIGAWFKSVAARRWDVTSQSKLAWLLLLGTIPAGVIGALIQSTAEDAFRSPALVACMLLLFTLPMVAAERFGRQQRDIEDAGVKDAVLLGFAQSIALIPGVSRSGITISVAMFDGFKREQAAVFTFLLSGPIIAAAGGKQLFDIARGEGEGSVDISVVATGMLTAFVVGYAAIAFLIPYLRNNPLSIFVAYRVLLGLTVLGAVAAGAI